MTTEQVAAIDQYLNEYYGNDCKKLHKMIDGILQKLRFYDVDKEDFYSLANEIITKALPKYDFKQDFDGYIYSCLVNKFKTEMTRRNRYKRKADKMALSLDASINEEDESTLEDIIPSGVTIENEVFKENKEDWRKEIQDFLDSLSPLQKEIALLLSNENTPDEICKELHITMQHYKNSVERIFADEKIKILRPLVERM